MVGGDTRIARMCGIAGLFAKSPVVTEHLGEHLGTMLTQLNDRGPDSAGVAVYRDPAPSGASKVSLFSPDPHYEWGRVRDGLAGAFGGDPEPEVRASHAVFVVDADAERAEAWLRDRHPELRIMSVGETIEIFKEAGLPSDFVAASRSRTCRAATRWATRGWRPRAGSRRSTRIPFSTGLDLCLVHNGSLSNHNRLRRELQREGVTFQTDNDTEVAAGYLTWRLREGADLREALEGCLRDLDGFFTFAVGTADGFAVLRDPIACKPAVLAETDDWVAMASEYRAIAVLPGAEDANVWEPAPATLYVWERALVR